ncbi:MAG TPA: DUF489 family protein [Salinisphaeraceae bacterium]|nr:DUF489 family protein [Salinisphaeraceae bacterium]
MSNSMRDRALALAGVAQFALYAHELGSAGRDLRPRMEVARHAIFCTEPDTVMDVYGNLSALGDGIAYLKKQLAGRSANAEAALVARYMGQLLRLARRLRRDDTASNQLRGAIDRARLAESADTEDILATAYQHVISPMKPRIMLRGHPSYLENPAIQARVRTQLLAAIRCGFLWYQCGGNFPLLLLRRKALLASLHGLGPAGNR